MSETDEPVQPVAPEQPAQPLYPGEGVFPEPAEDEDPVLPPDHPQPNPDDTPPAA